jgi:hypothetical protein
MMRSQSILITGSAMQTPDTRIPGKMLAVVGLAALLTAGVTAQAQTRAGSNGRALDANQQVGTGGVNPADGRLDFSRQNDIITGNVGGGRGFQDDIGYGAVGEFTDTERYRTGTFGRSDEFNDSNTLYDFRASSLTSSPSYFNAATVGGVNQRNNFRVFRGFTNRSTQPQSPGLIAPQGGKYRVGSAPAFSTIYNGQIRTDAFRDSTSRFAPGRALQAFSQAPNTGLDRVPDVTSKALSRKFYDQAGEANEYEISSNLTDSLRLDTNVFDPFGKTQRDKAGTQPLQPGQIPPTLMIGQQLQLLIDPATGGIIDPTRSQQVLDSVFQRLDTPNAQADDAGVYVKLLRDIKDGKTGDGPDDWIGTLDAPTSQQLTEAERAYDEIMKEMYGEDYKTRRAERDSTDDPGAGDEEVRGVVDQLNYDLPRLESLAGNKQTRIAKLTREAEVALANGKYLTAESRFRQLLLDTKDDPLPRAGLVHAQLGAGMFRSAGMNLRALFVQHPELIAARYDAKLLPPEDRLQWIQQELQSVIGRGEGGKDAPLLLAYLGYQANSRQVVRYGLALAQSQSPRDPFLAVVREIWLDESDTSDGE